MQKNKIRYMDIKDLDYVVEIERENFKDAWSFNAFKTEIENSELTHYFIVEDLEKIIGYFGILIVLDECQIHTVSVDKEYRQNGIGSEIMEFIIRFSLDREVKTVNLEVDVNNKAAISLYEKYKFEKVGYIKDYYINPKSDAYIMEKNLKRKGEING